MFEAVAAGEMIDNWGVGVPGLQEQVKLCQEHSFDATGKKLRACLNGRKS